jgi:hypothetical protein
MCDVRLQLKGRTGHVRDARVLAWGVLAGLTYRTGLVVPLGRRAATETRNRKRRCTLSSSSSARQEPKPLNDLAFCGGVASKKAESCECPVGQEYVFPAVRHAGAATRPRRTRGAGARLRGGVLPSWGATERPKTTRGPAAASDTQRRGRRACELGGASQRHACLVRGCGCAF